jgi:hypothetical protein
MYTFSTLGFAQRRLVPRLPRNILASKVVDGKLHGGASLGSEWDSGGDTSAIPGT